MLLSSALNVPMNHSQLFHSLVNRLMLLQTLYARSII